MQPILTNTAQIEAPMISQKVSPSQSTLLPAKLGEVSQANTCRHRECPSSFTSAGALALALNYFSTPSQGNYDPGEPLDT